MYHFIYTITDIKQNKQGGKMQTINVYRIKRNCPVLIGDKRINTSSYVGDRGIAYQIISDVMKWKMKDHYRLEREDVNLYSIM